MGKRNSKFGQGLTMDLEETMQESTSHIYYAKKLAIGIESENLLKTI